MKWTKTILTAAVALLLLVFAREKLGTSALQHRLDELERERTQLVDYVQRLTASRRVAQVTVVDSRINESGHTVHVLSWQEIGADGLVSQPVLLEAIGRLVYFESLVVKFDHQLVGDADADRGRSVVLFRRVFGDRQAPDSVPLMDQAAPPFAEDARSTSSGRPLWERFWQFVDDPALARQYGVRVAQIEAPAVPMGRGQVWEIAVDASGGVNLRKLREGETALRIGRYDGR